MPHGVCGRTAREVNSSSAQPPNGLELSRSAEAGNATHTLAPAGDQDKPHADSAERQVDLSIAHTCGHRAPTYPHARRVGFSELLGVQTLRSTCHLGPTLLSEVSRQARKEVMALAAAERPSPTAATSEGSPPCQGPARRIAGTLLRNWASAIGRRQWRAQDSRARPASRRCHQADKGAHESEGQDEGDLDTQVEFEGDVEEEVIDEMDGGKGGERDCRYNRQGVPLGASHAGFTSPE